MTNDADWVEDVRRWVAGTNAVSRIGDPVDTTEAMALGYEAAHPALQARHWPEAVQSGFGDGI